MTDISKVAGINPGSPEPTPHVLNFAHAKIKEVIPHLEQDRDRAALQHHLYCIQQSPPKGLQTPQPEIRKHVFLANVRTLKVLDPISKKTVEEGIKHTSQTAKNLLEESSFWRKRSYAALALGLCPFAGAALGFFGVGFLALGALMGVGAVLGIAHAVTAGQKSMRFSETAENFTLAKEILQFYIYSDGFTSKPSDLPETPGRPSPKKPNKPDTVPDFQAKVDTRLDEKSRKVDWDPKKEFHNKPKG